MTVVTFQRNGKPLVISGRKTRGSQADSQLPNRRVFVLFIT